MVATWAGTIKTYTLALLLKNMGYGATVHHGFLEVENRTTDLFLESALRDISESPRDLTRTSLPGLEERMSERFHCYLSSELLYEDAVTSVVDLAAMPQLAENIIKPKPRWDVHLLSVGSRAGSLAGMFRPLTAGQSGSAVSPRLSG